MGEAMLYGQSRGGGSNLNGIVEEYQVYAGENISAGDFVEFVNVRNSTIETAINSYFYYTFAKYVKACLIDENRALLLFNAYSYSDNLQAHVIDFEGAEMTIRAECRFETGVYYHLDLCYLEPNKALITFSDYSNGSDGTAAILTVSGNTVSMGTEFVFCSVNTSYISSCLLEPNKVLIGYKNGSTLRGEFVIATIDGDTVTFSNAHTINSNPGELAICKVDTNKVFIACKDLLNSNYGNSYIALIENDSITFSERYTFNSATTTELTVCSIGTNKILLVFENYSTKDGIVLAGKIDGTTVTYGETKVFQAATNNIGYHSLCAIEENKALFCYGVYNGTNYTGYAMIATVDGLNVTTGDSFEFQSTKGLGLSDAVLIRDNTVFLPYNGGSHIYITMFGVDGYDISHDVEVVTYEKQLALATDTPHDGVAKTSGSAGETIEIFTTEEKAEWSPVNGILKEYYVHAGENVSAGDFVNFVKGIASAEQKETTHTLLDDGAGYTGYYANAVALDENRVFIAYNYSNAYYLHAMVVTIDGDTITTGTKVVLSETRNSGYEIDMLLLANGNVFLTYRGGASNFLYGMVCTIDGTTITAGTGTALNSSKNDSGYHAALVMLPSGKIFIPHANSSSSIFGLVVTIDGTTITAGTLTTIFNSSGGLMYGNISASLLPNGNVFVAYGKVNDYTAIGVIASINDTTITVGTATTLASLGGKYPYFKTMTLNENNVLVVYNVGGDVDAGRLHGQVVTVNQTTITAGTDAELCSQTYSGQFNNLCMLSDGNILITTSSGSGDYLRALIVSINGTTINVISDADLETVWASARGNVPLLRSDGSVFIVHCNTSAYHLYARIYKHDQTNNTLTYSYEVVKYETQVKKAASIPFDAVAKTGGTGGTDTAHNEKVQVYTL